MEICIDCGQKFENKGHRHRPYCPDCALKRMYEASEQMANRDGPYYEKWLEAKHKAVENYRKSMEKAVRRYAEALDLLEHDATPVGQAEILMRIGNLHRALGEE